MAEYNDFFHFLDREHKFLYKNDKKYFVHV